MYVRNIFNEIDVYFYNKSVRRKENIFLSLKNNR